jgi:hypothetical protein
MTGKTYLQLRALKPDVNVSGIRSTLQSLLYHPKFFNRRRSLITPLSREYWKWRRRFACRGLYNDIMLAWRYSPLVCRFLSEISTNSDQNLQKWTEMKSSLYPFRCRDPISVLSHTRRCDIPLQLPPVPNVV